MFNLYKIKMATSTGGQISKLLIPGYNQYQYIPLIIWNQKKYSFKNCTSDICQITFSGFVWLVECIGTGFNQVQATLKFDPLYVLVAIFIFKCKLNIFPQLGFSRTFSEWFEATTRKSMVQKDLYLQLVPSHLLIFLAYKWSNLGRQCLTCTLHSSNT